MPSTSYLLTVLAIVFALTFALRALPLAVLRTCAARRWCGTCSWGCRSASSRSSP
ncbi:hypothetical protein ACWDBO_18515 [Streptomyces mirabilis]|uniref:hypothetical protein n=1 Tax=Streptomyces mirabilis TaxID=68239 RepID=UPI003323B3B1